MGQFDVPIFWWIIDGMKWSTAWAIAATLILAALAGAWLGARTMPPTELQFGTRIDPPLPIPATRLVEQDGSSFDRSSLKGRWSLLFFGFTHCPGICPMTLTTLAQVRKQLVGLDEDELPQVVLVSVDPERDTPARMADYVAKFDSSFMGVTGTPSAIDEFTGALGIAHKKIGAMGDDYMVDHTAAIVMLDPQGRRIAVFSPPFTAEHLAADYLRVLGRG
jgi:protein SCO1/2